MEGLKMKTKSFSKGFPCGYQWNCVLKIIACLCFVSLFCSLAGAMNISKTSDAGISLETDRTVPQDVGLDAASRHVTDHAE
jgi:hypothetical protein